MLAGVFKVKHMHPELMLREGLSVLLLADSRDVSHVSVHTRRLSP